MHFHGRSGPVAHPIKAILIGFETPIGRLRPQLRELSFQNTPPDLGFAIFEPRTPPPGFQTDPIMSSGLEIGGWKVSWRFVAGIRVYVLKNTRIFARNARFGVGIAASRDFRAQNASAALQNHYRRV